MGMNAVYMQIDDKTLDAWLELDAQDLSQAMHRLEESQSAAILDLAKIWDILHYYLTGASASTPIEEDPLSEAVVGVHVFDEEDEAADFIACTEYAELPLIIDALCNFNHAQGLQRLTAPAIESLDLYPKGIELTAIDQLHTEVQKAIQQLIAFYQQALEQRLHIIVSIV
ncbi:DUF1877 family protein [Pseudomonas sp. F1_0610]|uniref:DUF1877 family protein n=1 Tax=Pseudomonas sp. F1_0610 TaxID=3114284 RepID=UPI0039C344D9